MTPKPYTVNLDCLIIRFHTCMHPSGQLVYSCLRNSSLALWLVAACTASTYMQNSLHASPIPPPSFRRYRHCCIVSSGRQKIHKWVKTWLSAGFYPLVMLDLNSQWTHCQLLIWEFYWIWHLAIIQISVPCERGFRVTPVLTRDSAHRLGIRLPAKAWQQTFVPCSRFPALCALQAQLDIALLLVLQISLANDKNDSLHAAVGLGHCHHWN